MWNENEFESGSMTNDISFSQGKNAGFTLERHGGNHDIYRRGNDIEKVPGHKEVNESLARMILRKWKLL